MDRTLFGLAMGGVLSICAVCAAPATAQTDCDGPAAEAEPGTSQWNQREADNVYCGGQRSDDTSSNPLYAAAATEVQAEHGGPVAEDPFRDPARLDGTRFRHQVVSFENGNGDLRSGLLFRPCDSSCHDMPSGLRTYEPPYPAVVVVHGGAADQEMYLWGVEALAEAGYMVLTFQIPEPENASSDAHYPDSRSALDYLFSTPQAPAKGGAVNPRWAELDRDHVGLAGHSAGGVAVSRLGQEDPRVSAIVSWDRAQSSPLPDDLALRTPALFVTADFNCQRVPVCLPEAYATPPDPFGPGNKDQDFQRVSGAGIDSMKVALRAATHLDFTQFAPTPPSSRYGAVATSYYTLAWFDRYLRGGFPIPGGRATGATLADDALTRLTAESFDDSADVHSISGGTFDPATQSNQPALIGGQPVADRLSFHFRSAYYLAGGRLRCEDIRAGCPQAGPAPPVKGCAKPRLKPRRKKVNAGKATFRPRVVCPDGKRSVVVRLRLRGRPKRVATGERVRLRHIPDRQRRIRAVFTVDGRRQKASIALVH